ncbi:putative polysaccharide biosynthesis protein [Bacillus sp. 1NLA3E]|uniref:putative polysaccharide biosynthesis protein n=1 Tax=Bacillus sp. 1NLA3E TaxID=666686 RepID=UPI000247EF26|nr:oligosaccharide flippase family protein [Bacillus sp. 1NLA3E]AGK51838.1 polysaccharide biosynthesis protein [Bacillus sp. 1NLA3E]
MEPRQNQDVLKGVLILTIGAILTKILSAVYRIPFQNMVGDVGFYIYQQVYPFYGLALVLTTNGFPVIISKLYSEKKSRNEDEFEATRLLFTSFFFLFIVGILAFSGMYFGADFFAGKMKDPHLAVLFRVISIIFIILPFNSVFRGYFQGNGDMLPTAVSQVGEQLIRVTTILVLAALFMHEGYSLYIVGGGAAFGSITGGIVSGVILATFFSKRKRNSSLSIIAIFRSVKMEEVLDIVKTLTFQGFAICITGMLLIFIQMADSINLYTLLVSSGIGEFEAKQLKGIYDRGQPLLQLGTVLATSMSLSLVPLISSEKMKKNKDVLVNKIQTALKISIMVGVGGSIGLMCIIKPTNVMLFENSQGSNILAIICLLILFSSIIITISSILQGLGVSILPAGIILLGFSIKCLLNIPFVLHFGTLGAAIASVVAMIVILILLSVKLTRVVGQKIMPKGYIQTIAFASLIMGSSLLGYIKVTDMFFPSGRFFASLQSLTAVMIGGALYLIFVLKSGVFKEEELVLLPLGSKLIALLPKK